MASSAKSKYSQPGVKLGSSWGQPAPPYLAKRSSGGISGNISLGKLGLGRWGMMLRESCAPGGGSSPGMGAHASTADT